MTGQYRAEVAGIILAVVLLGPAIWMFTKPEFSQEDTQSFPSNVVSSGWCSGRNNIDRMCLFKNMCYSSHYSTFLFFHGDETILEGIPQQRFEPALVDLSSVADHNTQYFHYLDVGVESIQKLSHRHHLFKSGKYLLFNRFNPSNLMHVFHDDLLPLFYTLVHHNQIHKDLTVTLLAFEGWMKGEYFNLYRIFSKEEPMLKKDFDESTLTCFQEMYVGLSKLSTWYQYGFNNPQGPLSDLNVTSFHIKHFRSFLQSKLNLSSGCPMHAAYGVLLSRDENRLIVNEAELALTISHVFNIKITTLSLESHSLVDIIQEVSCAKILVGVHGSLLVLSMFLPPSSVLLEIFPYAINPDNYTPYKTLVTLPGMDVLYYSWRNMEKENTITHADADPEYGGILHLSEGEQKQIVESSEVRPHLCCEEPEWLFRIYQDTVVDVTEIIEILTRAMVQSSKPLSKKANWTDDIAKHRIAPGFISDLACTETVNKIFQVTWTEPWNNNFIKLPQLQFEVRVQGLGSSNLETFIVNQTFFDIKSPESFQGYLVWVRALAMEIKGPHSWVQC